MAKHTLFLDEDSHVAELKAVHEHRAGNTDTYQILGLAGNSVTEQKAGENSNSIKFPLLSEGTSL